MFHCCYFFCQRFFQYSLLFYHVILILTTSFYFQNSKSLPKFKIDILPLSERVPSRIQHMVCDDTSMRQTTPANTIRVLRCLYFREEFFHKTQIKCCQKTYSDTAEKPYRPHCREIALRYKVVWQKY